MEISIALLRGINVGGRNRLPMDELVTVLQGMGLSEIATHLQSGNAVFRSGAADPESLARDIAAAIEASHGFAPQVLLLGAEQLEAALGANPFPEAEDDPSSLHLFFLAASPTDPDLDRLESLRTTSERFELEDRVLYLHAPDGIGRSRLAAGVERALGVPVTARNWRTATRVMELATRTKARGERG